MHQITTIDRFHFAEAGTEIAVLEYDGEPVWLATQLDDALGYAKGKTSRLLRDSGEIIEGKHYFKLTGAEAKAAINAGFEPLPATGNGSKHTSNAVILTEPGLYLALMASEAPRAAAFRRWLAEEVLPTIRRTGSYVAPSAPPVTSPAVEQALATLATVSSLLVQRLDAIERKFDGVRQPESVPSAPSGALTASAIARVYGTTRGKVGSTARKLRREYGKLGIFAVGSTFPPGKPTWWYEPLEVERIATELGLQPVENVLTMFRPPR